MDGKNQLVTDALASIGLPVEGQDWQPEMFFQKWLSTLAEVTKNNSLDMIASRSAKDESIIHIDSLNIFFVGALNLFHKELEKLAISSRRKFLLSELNKIGFRLSILRTSDKTNLWSVAEFTLHESYKNWLDDQCQILSLIKEDNSKPSTNLNLSIISDEIIEDDARIPFKPEHREELIKYFLKLVKLNILSNEDVCYWLCADFQGFKTVSENRILKPKTEKGIIVFFVRQIFDKYEENRKRMSLYRQMLRDRISLCNNQTEKYIKAHFSDPKPKKFPDALILK